MCFLSSGSRTVASVALVLLVLSPGHRIDASSILEFFLGPKIGIDNDTILPKSADSSTAEELVHSNGYPFEEHEVTSEDGYIITLHRIPRCKATEATNKTRRPVVLLQHGLLASSDTFLFQGANIDLPYLLADAGYDVWLSNMRGNFYSTKHRTLDPKKDPEYWKFSLHEVGYYDLPAVIDYVLNTTKEHSLYFIGHSIGSSVGMILGSLRPEYNSKIKLHISLSPLVYVLHDKSLPHRMILQIFTSLAENIISDDLLNIFPRRKYFSSLMHSFCSNDAPTHVLCLLLTYSLVGVNEEFNTNLIPDLVSYFPAGSSIYLLSHTTQIYLEGTFRPLDYKDSDTNLRKYRCLEPPVYNITSVTHPISLHYSDGDYLVTKQDIKYILDYLPNTVGMFEVPFKEFNHIDFIVGTKAKELLYDDLILLMNKYK